MEEHNLYDSGILKPEVVKPYWKTGQEREKLVRTSEESY